MGNTVTRQFLFDSQRGKCHYCNCRMNMKYGGKNLCTRDHIVTKGEGGGNERTNLVGSCITCNNLRGQIPYWAFKLYISLHGRDRKIKDVLRSLSREEYESQKHMWDAIKGHKNDLALAKPPVMNHDPVPVYLRPGFKPRRDILQVTRRNIEDIVTKTPYAERNMLWGRHLKKEKQDATREERTEGGICSPVDRGWAGYGGGRAEAHHAFFGRGFLS